MDGRSRWFLPVLMTVCLLGGAEPRTAGAQESVLAEKNRAPRFLFATTSGLIPLDIDRTPALARRITLTLEGVPLREALAEIARQSGVEIGFPNDIRVIDKQIRLAAREMTVAAVLTDVLFGAGLDVVFDRNGQVTLTRRMPALPGAAPRSVGILTGHVTEQGAATPISGVTIVVPGKGPSAVTNDKGEYRMLGVSAGEHEVTARRLGFAPTSRKVRVVDGETVTADFTLSRATTTLSEVVTTATGERSRLEVGNSIGTIKADSLVPTTLIRTMSDLLTARTPGVIVSSANGAVGAPSKIRIRGINSIQLNNDPIIIIDGVRLNSLVTSAGSQTNTGIGAMGQANFVGASQPAPSRFDDIDPNTIESIDVLRGPSAASLYGTEAANGVIVIKTKKGAAGPFRFNLLADDGQSRMPGRMPDLWYGWGHLSNGTVINNCTLFNGGGYFGGQPNVVEGTCVQDSITHFNPENVRDLATLGTGSARNVSANMSGGTQQLKEFLSLRISDQVGIAKMSDVEQRRLVRMWGVEPPSWMLHPNTSQDVNGSSRTNLQLGTNLDVSLTANGAYRNVVSGAAALPAGTAVIMGLWDTLTYLPAESQRARQASVAKRGFVSMNANYAPAGWLTFRGALGGDYTLRTNDALARAADCTVLLNPTGCRNGHLNDRGETFVTTMDVGAQLSAAPTSWMTARTSVGEQYNGTRFYGLSAGNGSSTNLAFGTDLLTPTPIATSGTPQLYAVTESRDESATAGWYLEQAIALRERVFLNVGFRQDAASAFGPSVNKSAPIYPKFSVSWLLSDEPFFPAGTFISSLRLRTAYGHSGNQARQNDVLANYQQGTAQVNGVVVPGIVLSQVANPDLKPERTTELEGGLDISFFSNERVHLEGTLYRKLSQDAIMQFNLPGSYGTAGIGGSANLTERLNVGSVENRGLELSVAAKILESRTFGWDATVNFTQNSNKLVHKDPAVPHGNFQFIEGYPVFGFSDFKMLSYADLNGDGLLGFNEVTFSSGGPGTIGGFTFIGAPYPRSELTYDNGFTFFSGALRVGSKFDQVNGQTTNLSAGSTMHIGARCWVDRTCTIAQQAAAMEALTGTLTGWMRQVSTLRFSELSLTYTVPRLTARRLLRSQSAALTFAGRNLAVWSTYAGNDPNVNSAGTLTETVTDNGSVYPQPRSWTIRVNLGF